MNIQIVEAIPEDPTSTPQWAVADESGAIPEWYEKPFPYNMLCPNRGDYFLSKAEAALAVYEFNEAYRAIGDSYNHSSHPFFYAG